MPRWRALPDELDPRAAEFVVHLRRSVDRSGLSVVALAERTGYSRTSWERFLDGRLLAPRRAVDALAEVTGTSPVHLTTLWELAEQAWDRPESSPGDRATTQLRVPPVALPVREVGGPTEGNSWGLAGYKGPSRVGGSGAAAAAAGAGWVVSAGGGSAGGASTGGGSGEVASGGGASVGGGSVGGASAGGGSTGGASARAASAGGAPAWGSSAREASERGASGRAALTGAASGEGALVGGALGGGAPVGSSSGRAVSVGVGSVGVGSGGSSVQGVANSVAPSPASSVMAARPGPRTSHRWLAFALAAVTTLALAGTAFLLTDSGPGRTPVAANSPSPSVSSRVVLPPGVKCSGAACGGKDAEVMGCGGDLVTTVKSATVAGRRVEVRYSRACAAAWGRILQAGPGDVVQVLAGRVRERGEVTVAGDTNAYTPMVAVRTADEARACVVLASGERGCTR